MTQVLARKYRPSDFSQVVGQESTIAQITGALKNGSLGHALLFCGTRGTGKTTTARIIARALNPELSEAELGLTVTELDAASNNGVDEIRALIDTVRYTVRGHRVVILDEAHMLSRNAFNALLKTLEEPPRGVTFILVTTEPHKLPATVKSRCQVYEFKDVDLEALKDYYKQVAQEEGLELTDEQLQEVSLRAEGSVRDGLSLLQKFLSGEKVTSNADQYYQLVRAIYIGDTTTALATAAEICKAEEPRTVIQNLEKWWYWASLESFGTHTPIRDMFAPEALQHFDLLHLQTLFEKCLQIERNFTATPNSKVVLEMGIIDLTLKANDG